MNNRLVSSGLLAATAFAALSCANPLQAQRLESKSQGRDVREAYAEVVRLAKPSVVEVAVAGESRVLGTVVAPDLIVTKYSELGWNAGKASQQTGGPELTCQQGERSWTCVQVGFDRPADLALLRVAGARLTPINWQMTPPMPGAFLATPDGTRLPLGVGILSAAPYQHTRPRAFLGIRFANPNGGSAELEEAVEHGAARAAGLKSGDVIVGFAEQAIASAQDLREQLSQRKPGDKVQVKVRRDESELSVEVTLGTNNSARPSNQENIWGPLSDVRSGFKDVLQHDTVLEPGDCGGPVVDLSGKAVGVNIARAGRVETLALPAAAVQTIVTRLLDAESKQKPAKKKSTGSRATRKQI